MDDQRPVWTVGVGSSGPPVAAKRAEYGWDASQLLQKDQTLKLKVRVFPNQLEGGLQTNDE